MEKRQFVGTWFMVIVLGFFGIFPGVIWWYVNRRLGYLMSRDYMIHAKTGKLAGATARLGGIQAKIYEFFENIGQFGCDHRLLHHAVPESLVCDSCLQGKLHGPEEANRLEEGSADEHACERPAMPPMQGTGRGAGALLHRMRRVGIRLTTGVILIILALMMQLKII